ncbi:MAG: hypothetical protein ACYDAK_13310 [Candidatus Limnocylindrales bacterium]
MNLKIKIITGFRKDQHHTIDAEEAHKAYYLFLHPEERGVFNDGTAIVGSHIQAIEPDYNATMGWNASYQIGDDDWNEIKKVGIDLKLKEILFAAKQIGSGTDPGLIALPLSEARQKLLS